MSFPHVLSMILWIYIENPSLVTYYSEYKPLYSWFLPFPNRHWQWFKFSWRTSFQMITCDRHIKCILWVCLLKQSLHSMLVLLKISALLISAIHKYSYTVSVSQKWSHKIPGFIFGVFFKRNYRLLAFIISIRRQLQHQTIFTQILCKLFLFCSFEKNRSFALRTSRLKIWRKLSTSSHIYNVCVKKLEPINV